MGFHSSGWFAYIRHDENQDRPKVDRQLLRRVWSFAQPHRRKVGLLLLTLLLISGLSNISPLLYRDLIDTALPEKDFWRLNILALGMVLVPLLNGLIGVWQRRLSSQVGEGIIYDLRRALFDHMQSMSLRFFTETRTGELMSRLNNDVVGSQRAITGTLLTIVSNVVALMTTLPIMLFLEWRLTLLGLVILPLFVLPARRVGLILRRMRRQSMEYNAEMNASINETLNVSGALLVKLFGRTGYEREQFATHASRVRDIGIESAVVSQWFFWGLSLSSAIGTAMVFWLGGYLVLQDQFSIGDVVAFGTYLTQLYGPLMSLTNAPVEFAQSMVSFERVFEALDIPVEIEEAEGATALGAVDGLIEFDDVWFSYQPAMGKVGLDEVARFTWGGSAAHLKRGKAAQGVNGVGKENGENQEMEMRWALEALDFRIEPGQLVALVGPSGAGKTSTTYLIPRLYDPHKGTVRIDGHDIQGVTLASLADNIGMVTQETYLFYDTIRANLLYARSEATEEEIVAAAQAANIHELIMSLPDGYETVVGERGYRLSGGERQRMAIARVILKDPRILVLDEATSSLDSLSEKLIQEALHRVMEGRTSLVIAHRLSTILAADKILVLDNGRLVEQGTHSDLLAQGGLYATLYETQFQTEQEQ
ncbi:MAG TPA: ABC transporter ATP-binding protein [Anaerolineae bacterium]|nr:ABC transporter ATP-binding protein [Anaerolineae bacterium]